MQVTLGGPEIKEALRLYVEIILGVKTGDITMSSGNSGGSMYTAQYVQASIQLKDTPKIPDLPAKKKTITQADIEQVFGPVSQKKLDIS